MTHIDISDENTLEMIMAGVGIVGTAVLGLVKYIVDKQVEQIDDHDSRITALEKESVTRGEISSMESRLCEKMDRGFDRLTDRLDKALESKHKAP